MSYEPLHHKYRPQKFADLVGQSAIATTLTNAIVQKRIAPAYLLTGPRGTGKTSSARIIAKSLNCLSSSDPTPNPCGKCEVCQSITRGTALDVIEIDAASNTGVDNIREIIERAQLAPVQARYKVYVIDECHMLSSAAFNALLKTLEEPPDRVIFILATTDPQRVLPTIISRCQRFDYRRIPLQDMVKHLQEIAEKEEINIQSEAVTLVAQLSNGGLRDAESLLDQLSLLSGEITTERVWDLVGVVAESDLLFLIQAIKNQHPDQVIEKCRQLLDRGREPLIVLQNLTNFYLSLLIAKTAPDRYDLVSLTPSLWASLKEEVKKWEKLEILRGQQLLKECEVQLKNTTQPRLWLEVTLMGLLTPVQPQERQSNTPINTPPTPPIQSNPPNQSLTPPIQSNTPINTPPTPSYKGVDSNTPINTPPTPPYKGVDLNTPPTPPYKGVDPNTPSTPPYKGVDSNTPTQSANAKNLTNSEIWQEVLNNLSPPTTQSLVTQQCRLVEFNENSAEIAVSSEQIYKYHQSKLKNLVEAFAKVCQRNIKVNFHIDNKKTSISPSPIIPQEKPIIASTKPQENTTIPQENTTIPSTKPQENTTITSTKPQENTTIPSTKPQENTTIPYEEEESNSISLNHPSVKKAAQMIAKVFDGEILESSLANNKDEKPKEQEPSTDESLF